MKFQVKVPQLSSNDNTCEITDWHVKSGDLVKKGRPICDLTNSKATFTFEAEETGYWVSSLKKGTRLVAGDLLGAIQSENNLDFNEVADSQGEIKKGHATVFSKKAQDLIRKKNISEDNFLKHEFVTSQMVESFLTTKSKSLFKESEIKALEQSYKQALRSSLTAQVRCEKNIQWCQQQAVSMQALTAFIFGRNIIEEDSFFTQFSSEANLPRELGYAIDVGYGVRVFKVSEELLRSWSVQDWHKAIVDWSLRLMRKKVLPVELGIGGVIVTDLSSTGVSFFEPLMSENQSVILGVGGDLNEQVPYLSITMAFDHRLHSGLKCANFLNKLKLSYKNYE